MKDGNSLKENCEFKNMKGVNLARTPLVRLWRIWMVARIPTARHWHALYERHTTSKDLHLLPRALFLLVGSRRHVLVSVGSHTRSLLSVGQLWFLAPYTRAHRANSGLGSHIDLRPFIFGLTSLITGVRPFGANHKHRRFAWTFTVPTYGVRLVHFELVQTVLHLSLRPKCRQHQEPKCHRSPLIPSARTRLALDQSPSQSYALPLKQLISLWTHIQALIILQY